MPIWLLILEDLPEVGRAYLRGLRRYAMDEVKLASTPQEAEAMLGASGPVYLICDQWLGTGEPTGAELIARWKARYPQLEKAILVTGSDAVVARSAPGIDAVFEKPPDLDAIAQFFGFEPRVRLGEGPSVPTR